MKVLILINKVGLGDCIIHMNYIHEISKKYEKPVSILAKDNRSFSRRSSYQRSHNIRSLRR